jgi:hypothetical protein
MVSGPIPNPAWHSTAGTGLGATVGIVSGRGVRILQMLMGVKSCPGSRRHRDRAPSGRPPRRNTRRRRADTRLPCVGAGAGRTDTRTSCTGTRATRTGTRKPHRDARTRFPGTRTRFSGVPTRIPGVRKTFPGGWKMRNSRGIACNWAFRGDNRPVTRGGSPAQRRAEAIRI